MKTEPTSREVWLAFVVARLRSSFGAFALVLMLAVAVWQFASGNVGVGLVVLLIIVWTYAQIPAAVGAAIGVRRRESGKT